MDDFLFIALLQAICDQMIKAFMKLCQEINIPIAVEKTEWASMLIVFLGILMDGDHRTLSISVEKQEKALRLLNDITSKKKMKIKQMQVLTGYLNFLTKVIFAGRTFTRRMYAKYAKLKDARVGNKLKPHYHVRIDSEFHLDCEVWRVFLENYRNLAVCHPMVDLSKTVKVLKL